MYYMFNSTILSGDYCHYSHFIVEERGPQRRSPIAGRRQGRNLKENIYPFAQGKPSCFPSCTHDCSGLTVVSYLPEDSERPGLEENRDLTNNSWVEESTHLPTGIEGVRMCVPLLPPKLYPSSGAFQLIRIEIGIYLESPLLQEGLLDCRQSG